MAIREAALAADLITAWIFKHLEQNVAEYILELQHPEKK